MHIFANPVTYGEPVIEVVVLHKQLYRFNVIFHVLILLHMNYPAKLTVVPVGQTGYCLHFSIHEPPYKITR